MNEWMNERLQNRLVSHVQKPTNDCLQRHRKSSNIMAIYKCDYKAS